jgi:large subunit ribosomal protein L21
MFAVIKTGGKQYRVSAGDLLKVESLQAGVGEQITLNEVLALGEGSSLKLGSPLVADASVRATVVSHGRHAKVRIFKMRRRKHFMKHAGHRQNFTELRIDQIG